jgi:branched-chain amino acid transport system permease protein
MLAQTFFNSLVLGMTYVMMACGLSLVLGVSLLINWPQGALYMAGAYVVYYGCTVSGVNYFLALLASLVLVGGFGMVIEKAINYPLRDAGFLRIMGASLGAMMFIEGLALLVFGEGDKNVANVFPGKVSLLGAILPVDRMTVIVLAALIMLGLYYFLQRTKEGKAIRAVAQNRSFAAVQGISISRTRLLSMGIGCGLAGLSGGLLAPIFYVSPFIGFTPLLKSIIVVTLGGLGSLPGSFVAGLILGFIEGFGYAYLGTWTTAISFALLMLILLVKHEGLFGGGFSLE